MVIVYYKNEDGKIVMHDGDANTPFEEMKERAEAYNARNRLKLTAHVVEVEDDSLTAYLFQNELQLIQKYSKEIFRDEMSGLRDVLKEVNALLVKNTEG